jgi:hypothetical protein
MTQAIGSRVIEPLYRGQLAEVFLLLEDGETALEEVEGGLAQAKEQGVIVSRLDLLRIRGLALRKMNKHADAEAALRQCLNESLAASCRLVSLRAATHLAELFGDHDSLSEVLEDFPIRPAEPPVLRNAREILRMN